MDGYWRSLESALTISKPLIGPKLTEQGFSDVLRGKLGARMLAASSVALANVCWPVPIDVFRPKKMFFFFSSLIFTGSRDTGVRGLGSMAEGDHQVKGISWGVWQGGEPRAGEEAWKPAHAQPPLEQRCLEVNATALQGALLDQGNLLGSLLWRHYLDLLLIIYCILCVYNIHFQQKQTYIWLFWRPHSDFFWLITLTYILDGGAAEFPNLPPTAS